MLVFINTSNHFVIFFGKKLSSKKIIGDPKSFSLEERIFNTVCIIAFLALCFEVPFNFFIGLMVPACLCMFGILLTVYFYYISRFRRKSAIGIQLFSFVCNALFVVNYFFNSGTFGPNLLLFSLAFLLTVSIIPKAYFRFWISVNLLSVIIVLIVEYQYPYLAPSVYESRLSKAIDFGITYFVVITLTYFSITYIRKYYDIEKASVLEKNVAIRAQKKELERLSSEKDKLFSMVAHDIRTPLASIQAYLELLTEVDLNGVEKLDLEKQLLQITRDTSAMLTNVLSWTKTQMDGGAHVRLERIAVGAALNEGLTIEKNIAVKKGVTLELNCEGELQILADRNMFHLVLRNLVNNAIKFTPKTGLVEVSAVAKKGNCCIMVRDNGLGIDADQQENLFKLNAASTYGTNKEKGIGLGLLLCKEFTAMQGGEIWFENHVGQGSTFYLSFRLA